MCRGPPGGGSRIARCGGRLNGCSGTGRRGEGRGGGGRGGGGGGGSGKGGKGKIGRTFSSGVEGRFFSIALPGGRSPRPAHANPRGGGGGAGAALDGHRDPRQSWIAL